MFSDYIRTFFEQLSIFDRDSLKTSVACSKERKIIVIKRAKIKTSFSLSPCNLAIISYILMSNKAFTRIIVDSKRIYN